MGCLDRVPDPDEAVARMTEYYRELELLVSLLIVKHGERHEGGFRYVVPDEEAWRLRRELGTVEPVVIQTHEPRSAQYVIDVL